jgi:hypothetical protein
MARRGDRDFAKERHWRQMLRRWEQSKLPVRAFCSLHQVSEPSFYSWRRIIAQRDHEVATHATPGPPAFVPVHVVPATAMPAAFEIVLGNGRIVRVGNGFDADALRQLLAIVEEERSC